MSSPLTDRASYRRRIAQASPSLVKEDLIASLCTGRVVLDVGCIDHSVETALGLGDRWLHHRLKEVAQELVGLDILADEARRLGERGYDIRVGDATNFHLGRTFEVIVAGDLIEHLENPGLFLACAREHMDSSSRLIVTTPNPFNAELAARILFLGDIWFHEQHVTWIDPNVMWELADRCGLVVERFEWITTRFSQAFESPKLRARVVNRVLGAVMSRRPLARSDFAVVLRRA